MADITLYVVDETKLDNLSAKNDESKTFFSVSSGLGSAAQGLMWLEGRGYTLSGRGALLRRLAARRARERDLVRAMEHPIADRVGDGRVGQVVVPVIVRELARDDGRAKAVSIFENFQ